MKGKGHGEGDAAIHQLSIAFDRTNLPLFNSGYCRFIQSIRTWEQRSLDFYFTHLAVGKNLYSEYHITLISEARALARYFGFTIFRIIGGSSYSAYLLV